jgi:ATP-dependent Lhr-like helicase
MAGRPVRLEKVTQLEAWVTAADGETPTVPRWNAAKMPLSNRVCEEIIAFRSELKTRLEADPLSREKREQEEKKTSPHVTWIAARLDCGKANAEMIWQMYDAQHRISEIPTADFLLVEEHVEYPKDHLPEEVAPKKRGGRTGRKTTAKNESTPRARHYFFHSLIGRAANDALARVVSFRLSRIRGGNAIATPHDYGFVLSVTPQQEFTEAELPGLIAPTRFEEDLEAALAESEMVKYHFRNAAQTGLMVYRNYFDERKPMRKVHWSSEVIFNVLQRYEPDHILLREARREALHVYVDAAGALEFVHEQARRAVRLRKVSYVPPLSFPMYATKIKEALLVEDPFEMVERLYHLWWTQIEKA